MWQWCMFCMYTIQRHDRLPTDIRTPRTAAAGQDSIMAQAENLARLTAAQTPLMGGDNPELHPTDFAGIQPKVGSMCFLGRNLPYVVHNYAFAVPLPRFTYCTGGRSANPQPTGAAHPRPWRCHQQPRAGRRGCHTPPRGGHPGGVHRRHTPAVRVFSTALTATFLLSVDCHVSVEY